MELMRVHGSVSHNPLMMTSVPCLATDSCDYAAQYVSRMHQAITQSCNQHSIHLDDLS